MKISTFKIFALGLLAVLMSSNIVRACNLSDLTFISITGTTGPFVINLRLCVGMGITGSTKGGDQSTNSVFFGFWDHSPGFTVLSYTPNSMNGPMGCIMPSNNFGPDPYYGIQGEVQYTDPGYYGFHIPCTNSPYGCVNSNVLCGPARSFCTNFSFTVNQIPDSVRVFGAEGGGNPVGGCYPNPDMKVSFVPPLAVVWGDIEGRHAGAGIKLKWTTLEEINSDFFTIERALEDQSYEELGQVPAVGNSNALVRYDFMDPSPKAGLNRYRIVQVDKIGESTESEAIEVAYTTPDGLSWGDVGPNPASDFVNIGFYSPIADLISFQLRDVTGKMAMDLDVSAVLGGNELRLDLSKVNAGTYYLSMIGKNGKVVKKITKL